MFRALLLVVFAACAPGVKHPDTKAPRKSDLEVRIDAAVMRENLDERVDAIARGRKRVGAFLHGEKAQQDEPCLSPNCGLPETNWSVVLEAGCYSVVAAGGNGITSVTASIEGQQPNAAGEVCLETQGAYRIRAEATGHGVMAVGVYRKDP